MFLFLSLYWFLSEGKREGGEKGGKGGGGRGEIRREREKKMSLCETIYGIEDFWYLVVLYLTACRGCYLSLFPYPGHHAITLISITVQENVSVNYRLNILFPITCGLLFITSIFMARIFVFLNESTTCRKSPFL